MHGNRALICHRMVRSLAVLATSQIRPDGYCQ